MCCVYTSFAITPVSLVEVLQTVKLIKFTQRQYLDVARFWVTDIRKWYFTLIYTMFT